MLRLTLAVVLLSASPCHLGRVGTLGQGLSEVERTLANPALTTSAADATSQLPQLDGYDVPADWYVDLATLPRHEGDHGWLVEPGWYRITVEGYCLKPGTWGPSSHYGDGWVYAPLRGPRADVIRSILDRSYLHPDIHQHSKQRLLWAIIAKTRFSEMPAELQAVAATMLEPHELVDLQGGVSGFVPRPVVDKALARLPEPVRVVRSAQDRLRRAVASGTDSYEDMADIAIQTGEMPEGTFLQELPAGRWSVHDDGYFVRYDVPSYAEATLHIFVPDRSWQASLDAHGRVTRFSNARGHTMQVVYHEPAGPLTVEERPGYEAWLVERVVFTVDQERMVFDWPGAVWARLPEQAGLRHGDKVGAQGGLRKVDDLEDLVLDEEQRALVKEWRDARSNAERREIVNRLVLDRSAGDATSVDHYKGLLEKVSQGKSGEAVVEHQKSLIKKLVEFHKSLSGEHGGSSDPDAQRELDERWEKEQGDNGGKMPVRPDGSAVSHNTGYSQTEGISSVPR